MKVNSYTERSGTYGRPGIVLETWRSGSGKRSCKVLLTDRNHVFTFPDIALDLWSMCDDA